MKLENILTCLFSILVILGCSSTAESDYVEERKEKLNELKEECDFATVEYSFPEDIYILNSMPSEININSIIIISLCSIIATILVSIYPASKASSLDTVKTLKYE